MFVLTCPICQQAVKTRFARLGATATCPQCKKQFKVDEQTLTLEAAADTDAPTQADGTDAAQQAPKMVVEPIEELKVTRPPLKKSRSRPSSKTKTKTSTAPKPDSQAPVESASPLEPAAAPAPTPQATDELAAALVQEAKPESPAKPASTDSARKPARPRRRRGLDMKMVALILITFGLLIVVVVMVYQRSTKSPIGVELTQNTPTNNLPAPDPNVTPDHPVAVHITPKMLPDLPIVELSAPALTATQWTIKDSPSKPIKPIHGMDVVLWDAQMIRSANGTRAMVSGMYLADSAKVYRRGVLFVQLLNKDANVYAERRVFVPVVCSRDGLQVRVPVPTELMKDYASIICDFTPIDVVSDAMALQMAPERFALAGQSDAPVLKLALRNPHDKAIDNPTVVIEALTADGWPMGVWQGVIDARIGPRDTYVFQAAPPLDQTGRIGRFVVRAYGKRSSSS